MIQNIEMKLAILFPFFCITLVASETTLQAEYQAFKKLFNKAFDNPADELKSYNNFVMNFKDIEDHNKSNKLWKKGINQLTDMSKDEFNSKLNGYISMVRSESPLVHQGNISIDGLPQSVDWRQSGAISEVKDQMFCAACWAFVCSK